MSIDALLQVLAQDAIDEPGPMDWKVDVNPVAVHVIATCQRGHEAPSVAMDDATELWKQVLQSSGLNLQPLAHTQTQACLLRANLWHGHVDMVLIRP